MRQILSFENYLVNNQNHKTFLLARSIGTRQALICSLICGVSVCLISIDRTFAQIKCISGAENGFVWLIRQLKMINAVVCD